MLCRNDTDTFQCYPCATVRWGITAATTTAETVVLEDGKTVTEVMRNCKETGSRDRQYSASRKQFRSIQKA